MIGVGIEKGKEKRGGGWFVWGAVRLKGWLGVGDAYERSVGRYVF